MKEFETIVKSVTTEKSSLAQADGRYTFVVRKSATKVDVKHAIKAIYGVEVENVRMMLVPKKTRVIGRGRVWNKRPVYKKAIVTLKDKKTIDPNKLILKDNKKK
ncbi:50S ribosomal protein L23 [Candidatus Peregrinibacteria bacterium]|jgi:large subunit ribosomal protein L23|nr:50S ribosomal protein L23 [Candidatus Peregrinibacteria bacterium]MBT6401814.1 50S ribosomal protein L23 [candidate division WWE3 bacterium]MBT7736185.1 50S ribosomal protein L23 [Candidatus Peregrinibacteria bacterium]